MTDTSDEVEDAFNLAIVIRTVQKKDLNLCASIV